MRMTYLIHVVAGCVAIIAGYTALYAWKGGVVHRKAGRWFVYSMLTVGVFGILMAIVRGIEPGINVPAGALSAYLVATGWMTLNPATSDSRRANAINIAVAATLSLGCLILAVRLIAEGASEQIGRLFPAVMFGTVAAIGAFGDIRVFRSGGLRGNARLARHLWRMCFALFVAALSFFIGQAHVFPEPVRIPALLAMPVLAALATMIYWLVRVRSRQKRPVLSVSV